MDQKKRVPKLNEMENNGLKFVMNALRDLIKDCALLKQRKLFEEMQKAIEKANEKERRLNTRCSRLQSEIASNTSKIKAAIQLSEEDKNTIDTLNEELEKAWTIADELRTERCKNMEGDRFSETGRHSRRDLLFSSTISLQRQRQDFEEVEKAWTLERKSFQNEVKFERKKSENLEVEVKQLQQQIKNMNSILSEKEKEIKQLEINLKVVEEIKEGKELGKGDQTTLIDEIEKIKLQVFELEEELTNKERMIEELTKENKMKTEELDKLGEEILETRKDDLLTESVDVEKYPLDVKEKKKVKNRCENKKHRNCDKQINELCIKTNEMAFSLKLMEFSLSENRNLFSKVQNDNSMLETALQEEKEFRHNLSTNCNVLKAEAKKNMKLLGELENARNRYVSVIGKLETENWKLEKELATIEHCDYPSKIISLETDLVTIRKKLEENENYAKEISEEISKIKTEIEEFLKYLVGCLMVTDAIHTSFDIRIETKLNFCDGKLPSHKENIHSLILELKEKIKDIVECYKEIKIEKYKLYDEVELLRSQIYSIKEKESKWTETENIYFVKEENERAETFLNDQLSNLNNEVLSTDMVLKEIDKELELNEEAGFQEYETYLSKFKGAEKELQQNEETEFQEYETYLSKFKEVEKELQQNEETEFQECETYLSKFKEVEKELVETEFPEHGTYLSSIKPKTISSSLKVNSFFYELENKSLKEISNNSSITLNAERNSSLRTFDTQTEESEENFKFREAGDAHSSHRTTKRDRGIPEVITSQDLVKYRQQLRTKQKKLDTMKKELDGNSSSYSTNRAIYQKDIQKKIMNTMTVQKVQIGKNKRK